MATADAPAFASCWTVALPIPLAAPVTNATLPLSSTIAPHVRFSFSLLLFNFFLILPPSASLYQVSSFHFTLVFPRILFYSFLQPAIAQKRAPWVGKHD